MSKKNRRYFTSEEKVKILRKHLLDHKPVSDICDEYNLHPTQFYRWQKTFFENGAKAFEVESKSKDRKVDKKMSLLEEKISNKNGIIVELLEEHIQLKKELGLV